MCVYRHIQKTRQVLEVFREILNSISQESVVEPGIMTINISFCPDTLGNNPKLAEFYVINEFDSLILSRLDVSISFRIIVGKHNWPPLFLVELCK